MPSGGHLGLLADMFRGAVNIPTAVGAEGPAGVAKAFMIPQKYEDIRQSSKFKEAYAPLLAGIEESTQAGDSNSAVVQILSLRQQMNANNATERDIDNFTKPLMQNAFGSAQAKNPITTTAGQDTALQGATMMNPEQAGTAAQVAAKMPALRMGADVAQANINQSNQAVAQSQATTGQLIPAQSRLAEAQAGAYDRGEMAKRGGGANLNNMFRGNASTINQMDKQILGFFKPSGGLEPDVGIARQQAEEALKQRNFTAQALGMPEAELTPIYEPHDPMDKPDMKGPLVTYALRPKQEAQKQVAQQQEPKAPPLLGTPPPPAMGGGAQQFDANAGLQAPQQRPPFQAAVQNPLGALPEDFRAAILSTSQKVNTSYVRDFYLQQGYQPDEADALTTALKQQVNSTPIAPSPQQPTRDPFAPNF